MIVETDTFSRFAANSFSVRLAKYFIAKKGFRLGMFPEAADLVQMSDIVLTYADGMAVKMLCIIDRDINPHKQFNFDPQHIISIGEKCLKYSGSVGRNVFPIVVQCIEICSFPYDDNDRERLRRLRLGKVFGNKVFIEPWVLDVDEQKAWSPLPWLRFQIGRREYENIMRSNSLDDDALGKIEIPLFPHNSLSFLTYSLAAMLIMIFIAECKWMKSPLTLFGTVDVATLFAFGSLNPIMVFLGHEWFRLLTYAFVHASPIHLAVNIVAFIAIGHVLEKIVGHLWLFAIFFIGAFSGGFLSLMTHSPVGVSVGASGAIMGMVTAMLYLTKRMHPGTQDRASVQALGMQVLIPALIPIAIHHVGGKIDFSAHMGGAIGGVLAGALLLKVWPTQQRLPGLRVVAASIVCLSLALLIWGVSTTVVLLPTIP